ncbi:MAG: gamma carbonic anhydrase family protein [Emergencia sp.]|nr:gamma carbonic anhydrase family protein [Emergencia sp.]
MQSGISKLAHIAEESVIVGDVIVGDESTVLYYAVLRGDNGPIRIGQRTNIQEHCILHTDPGHQLLIGNDVTVGHGCILHGCQIDDETMIGMGTIVMNGAKIGKHCLIGAGSLVTENTEIPDGYLAFGRPAKPVKPLSPQQLAMLKHSAAEYVEVGKKLLG